MLFEDDIFNFIVSRSITASLFLFVTFNGRLAISFKHNISVNQQVLSLDNNYFLRSLTKHRMSKGGRRGGGGGGGGGWVLFLYAHLFRLPNTFLPPPSVFLNFHTQTQNTPPPPHTHTLSKTSSLQKYPFSILLKSLLRVLPE